MATALANGQIVQCVGWSLLAEQAAANVFNFIVNSVGSPPATDQDMADTFSPIYGAALIAIMPSVAQYRGTVAKILGAPLNPIDVHSIIGQGLGVSGTAALPRQATGLISWYSLFAGRAYRGRTYVPFPPQNLDSGNGVPSTAYTAGLTTMAGNLFSITSLAIGGRTATVSLYIRHRKLAGGIPVASWLARNVWATQRRRGAFGRPNNSPI